MLPHPHLSLCQEARTTYRRTLQESARKLNTQGSHLGSCIEKARPYYEARRMAKEVRRGCCVPAGTLSSAPACRTQSSPLAHVSLLFAYPSTPSSSSPFTLYK